MPRTTQRLTTLSTWSVAGDDSSKFDISINGALTFKAKPDFRGAD